MIRIEYDVQDIYYLKPFIGICWKEKKGNEENSEIIPGYDKQNPTDIFPNGRKYLEKYEKVSLENLEDDSTVTKILKHYQKEIEDILKPIEKDPVTYNM